MSVVDTFVILQHTQDVRHTRSRIPFIIPHDRHEIQPGRLRKIVKEIWRRCRWRQRDILNETLIRICYLSLYGQRPSHRHRHTHTSRPSWSTHGHEQQMKCAPCIAPCQIQRLALRGIADIVLQCADRRRQEAEHHERRRNGKDAHGGGPYPTR